MKKVYVNAQWQGGADRSTYDGAEELRKYLPGQDYVILPVSTEEAEMAVMRNGIRDLMFYTGRCSPLTSVCGKTHRTRCLFWVEVVMRMFRSLYTSVKNIKVILEMSSFVQSENTQKSVRYWY